MSGDRLLKTSNAIFRKLESQIDALKIGPTSTTFCVAFSGGIDSTVLLHAMARVCSQTPAISLRAIHVNHQLHEQAEQWADHCRQVCVELNVSLEVHRITVNLNSGIGPEGAARQARYDLFRERMRSDEFIVTAHHQQDQLETFLLQLLRFMIVNL